VRKIVTSLAAHNRAILALVPLLLLTACGGQGTATNETPGTRALAEACPAVITDHGVVTFYAVLDRLEAGEDVSLEEMGQLYVSPEYDRWRRSYVNEIVSQGFLGRMLFIALRGADELPERLQQKSQRIDIVRALKESVRQRRHIEASTAALLQGDVLCQVRSELDGWLPDGALPDTLRLDLVVGYPEIRLFEDRIMVDASLAWAAGTVQLPRFIASMFYKELADFQGQQPKNAQGHGILMESLRIVHTLVAPAMIEHTDAIVFDKRHEVLGGNGPDPVSIYEQAYRTLASLDAGLTKVRADENTDDEDWLALYRLFVGAQSWQATAWYMGQIIEERLGLETLQNALSHPADLYATYQRACLAQDDATGLRRGTVEWLRGVPPRFSAENAAWLEQELRAYFQ